MAGGGPSAAAQAEVEARLRRYADELASWGSRMNLVGSTDPARIQEQLAECLVGADRLPAGPVVDLGSGAGLPGVPIAIARPDLSVTLVEIRERRVHFLRHVARALPVGLEVIRARLEDPPAARARGFGVAVMRAVAPLRRSVELAGPWLTASGEIWVWTREDPGSVADLADPLAPLDLGERGHIARLRLRSRASDHS